MHMPVAGPPFLFFFFRAEDTLGSSHQHLGPALPCMETLKRHEKFTIFPPDSNIVECYWMANVLSQNEEL
jgi:hypothetical protein